MNDHILIKKISDTTSKSQEEIENILKSIDLKLINWVSKLDSKKIGLLFPILFTDTIVSKYLVIKILKTLKNNNNESN